jgi:hypothetical protein
VNEHAERTKRSSEAPVDWTPPEKIRRHLLPWIDLDEVGAEGFWSWLETLLPVIPRPERFTSGPQPSTEPPEVRLRHVARLLADCAGDRARLTFVAARYFQDNFVLALRVKALEAGLARYDRGRADPVAAGDEEARMAADRYLTRKR